MELLVGDDSCQRSVGQCCGGDVVVAALLRESYVAFAAELPPDLLRGWIDDVLDPRGATTLMALADGTLAGTARLHLATRTRSRSRPGASGCGPGYRRDPATDIDIDAHFGAAPPGSSIIRAPLALPPPVLPRSASAISYDATSAARAVRGESLLRGRTRGGEFGNC